MKTEETFFEVITKKMNNIQNHIYENCYDEKVMFEVDDVIAMIFEAEEELRNIEYKEDDEN